MDIFPTARDQESDTDPLRPPVALTPVGRVDSATQDISELQLEVPSGQSAASNPACLPWRECQLTGAVALLHVPMVRPFVRVNDSPRPPAGRGLLWLAAPSEPHMQPVRFSI